MVYSEYQPCEELKEIVKNYWHFEVADDRSVSFPLQHETLPHSEVSIVLIKQPYFEGIRLLGPQIKKFEKEIYPNSTYFGIRILPWLSFSPNVVDKEQLLNITADCPSLISNYFSSIEFDKSSEPQNLILRIEECLTKLFTEAVQVTQNQIIKYICLQLSAGQTVGSTISDLPISTRVLQKKFKEVVGMNMRKYYTIHRQRRLWTDFIKNSKTKTDLLHECGFFDQAHFINDFRKQMDRSHVEFEKRLKQIEISLA